MTSPLFPRVAFTCFRAPQSRGDLLVWSLDSQELWALAANPSFDPTGMIGALLREGAAGATHAGRALLEDRVIESLGGDWLEAGSIGALRSEALRSSTGKAADHELGFLDLLGRAIRPIPRSVADDLAWRLPEAFERAWGAQARYCGAVEEEAWDSYPERARAVLALLERGEIDQDALGASRESAPARL